MVAMAVLTVHTCKAYFRAGVQVTVSLPGQNAAPPGGPGSLPALWGVLFYTGGHSGGIATIGCPFQTETEPQYRAMPGARSADYSRYFRDSDERILIRP